MDEVPRPLTFTRSPKLDAALRGGWERWSAAVREAGVEALTEWLAGRAQDPDLAREVAEVAGPLFAAEAETEARIEALVGLAELAEELEDDLLADTLWEGVLREARAAGDPDALSEAISHLAAIAERHGDLLAAAEYRIEFLNWRRQPGHASDPEDVETAFEEIVRLAERDGARKEAAMWAYRQARFTRLAEAEDERAVEGDWEADPAPYAGWA